MITKELIDRINYLAKKKKEIGLTPEEQKEQDQVRRQYIDGIKGQLRPMLENIEIVDEEPSKNTPSCGCKDCNH